MNGPHDLRLADEVCSGRTTSGSSTKGSEPALTLAFEQHIVLDYPTLTRTTELSWIAALVALCKALDLEVYRREGDEWRLAHRHADPLVHPMRSRPIAAIARG